MSPCYSARASTHQFLSNPQSVGIIAVKLLVVIVSYRVVDLTIDCLHSVAAEIHSVPGARVAVCENGTGDDSAERIQKAIDDNGWASWCTLTSLGVNLGFTGGNNAVIRPALQSDDPPEYVLLLNADTIVRLNAFKALVDFMDQNPKVGIAGSRLEEPDGTPQRSAFRFQTPLGEFEGNLKLGLVSRLLSRWIVAPPVVNDTFETDRGLAVNRTNQPAGGLRRMLTLRIMLTGKKALADSIRHSVFVKGFKMRDVENPALAGNRS